LTRLERKTRETASISSSEKDGHGEKVVLDKVFSYGALVR
jgi:hypothetical protein